MTKQRVIKIYKSGGFIKGKMVSYGIQISFKYNLNTKKAAWHGEDEEEGFVDAMMLSDKYGIDYKETGNFIAEKCRKYAEANGIS